MVVSHGSGADESAIATSRLNPIIGRRWCDIHCALRDWLIDNARKCVFTIAACAFAGKLNCPNAQAGLHKSGCTLILHHF